MIRKSCVGSVKEKKQSRKVDYQELVNILNQFCMAYILSKLEDKNINLTSMIPKQGSPYYSKHWDNVFCAFNSIDYYPFGIDYGDIIHRIPINKKIISNIKNIGISEIFNSFFRENMDIIVEELSKKLDRRYIDVIFAILPDEKPFYSSTIKNEKSGFSSRLVGGVIFGENELSFLYSISYLIVKKVRQVKKMMTFGENIYKDIDYDVVMPVEYMTEEQRKFALADE